MSHGHANVWQPRHIVEVTGNSRTVSQVFVAETGQLSFTLTDFAYTPQVGALSVYKDGLKLALNLEWVEISATSFALLAPAEEGAIVEAIGDLSINSPIVEPLTLLGDGVWTAGKEYTGYNQVLAYLGVTYKVKLTTAVPYTTGATPDTAFVEAVDYSEASLVAYNAENVKTALDRVEGDITTLQSDVATLGSEVDSLTDLQVSSVADLKAVTNYSAGQSAYLSAKGRSGQFEWTVGDFTSEVAADTLDAIYIPSDADPTGAAGCWVRALLDRVAPEMGGSVGNPAGEAAILQATYALKAMQLSAAASYSLETSLLLLSNKDIRGTGKSFGGSTLTPLSDTPAIFNDGSSQIVKSGISDVHIAASAVTTKFAVTLDNVFLSDFYNVWIKDSYKGLETLNSDALNFYSLMVMEDSDDDAVLIGEGSRNIRFVNCNFEKNPNNSSPGGIFRIDGGVSSRVADAVLIGCSFERSGIVVDNGRVTVTGGKFGASSLTLNQKSQLCSVDSKFEDGGIVFDAGFSNVVRNVFCRNMATPKHEWPILEQTVAGSTPLFGAVGDELLFLTTAGSLSNVGVTGGVIEIKDGATVLDTSPSFDLPVPGETIGLPTRPLYSHISAVKVPTTSAGPIFTGSKCFGISGGINLLANGTFDSGLATGWSLNSVVESPSGSDVLLLPTDTSWGIYQAISSICKYGKRYLVVARFNGNANLTLGDSWNGSAGARVLYDTGQLLGDGSGDSLAMVAFEYNFQRGNISLGKLGDDSAVTVKYFMMIEVG